MRTVRGIVDDDPHTRVDTTPIKENDMSTLTGLTTMVLTADDVAAAADWYSDVLGISPYFRPPPEGEPAYIEFRIGPDEDELGIMSRAFAPEGTAPGSSSVTYWHVDDVDATLGDLVSRGASVHSPVTPRGEEFVTASVIDPFGNVLGLMHSPHWARRH